MNNSISKNKILITVFLYPVFLAVIFYFTANYLLSEINNKNTLIQKNIVDQEKKEKRLSEIPKMKEQYQMALDEEKKFIPLINENKAVELIEELEKLAQNSGNKINIEIQNSVKTTVSKTRNDKGDKDDKIQSIAESLPGGDYLSLKINLQGSYNQLLDFIEKFEALSYYSDIISLDIKFEEKEKAPASSPFAQTSENATENNGGEQAASQATSLDSSISAVFYLEKVK
jgi:hypothetical protein